MAVYIVDYRPECVVEHPEGEDFSVDEMFGRSEEGISRHIYICPDELLDDGSALPNEDLLESARGYGFETINDIPNLEYLKVTVDDIFSDAYESHDRVMLVIDDITKWMIGFDREAVTFEDMYNEAQMDLIEDITQGLLVLSRKHVVILRTPPLFREYLMTKWPTKSYVLCNSCYKTTKEIPKYDWMK